MFDTCVTNYQWLFDMCEKFPQESISHYSHHLIPIYSSPSWFIPLATSIETKATLAIDGLLNQLWKWKSNTSIYIYIHIYIYIYVYIYIYIYICVYIEILYAHIYETSPPESIFPMISPWISGGAGPSGALGHPTAVAAAAPGLRGGLRATGAPPGRWQNPRKPLGKSRFHRGKTLGKCGF